MEPSTAFAVVCELDGRVVVTVDAVELRLGHGPQTHHYVFTCPVCKKPQVRRASAAIVSLLRNTGCREVRPAEPLSDAEVDAFAEWLTRHEHIAAWARRELPDGNNAQRPASEAD